MREQMVFPFIIEDNILAGRTCATCNKQEDCVEKGATISKDKTCGDWSESDMSDEQTQDSSDFMDKFDELMNKYSVSVDDRRAIYVNCQRF